MLTFPTLSHIFLNEWISWWGVVDLAKLSLHQLAYKDNKIWISAVLLWLINLQLMWTLFVLQVWSWSGQSPPLTVWVPLLFRAPLHSLSLPPLLTPWHYPWLSQCCNWICSNDVKDLWTFVTLLLPTSLNPNPFVVVRKSHQPSLTLLPAHLLTFSLPPPLSLCLLCLEV